MKRPDHFSRIRRHKLVRCRIAAGVCILAGLTLLPSMRIHAGTLSDYQDADAIVLEEERHCEITSPTRLNYIVHRTILINTADGNFLGEVSFGESKFRQLKKFKATVFDQNGRKVSKFSKDDLYKMSGFDGSSLYTDLRIRGADLTTAIYPYTLEYEYEVQIKSLQFWPAWKIERRM